MDGAPHDDEQLLSELRSALVDHDPVPDDVVAAARDAFGWRTLDADLAALSYDSLLDERELAGVRSAGDAARLLTFESPVLTVEVEVGSGRIIGQLVPPQPGEVEVRHVGGSTTVPADAVGRFVANGVPAGPVSLRCRTTDATAVVTDWIVL
ncbi:MAG TPA: hypothetical protein VEZ46_02410 [Mycobacteriales bacterium]|jgi:hypothetical protein|nr:hypothetical protein [Mycobacteriales bacterium]